VLVGLSDELGKLDPFVERYVMLLLSLNLVEVLWLYILWTEMHCV